jgi:hypothetical protein
MTIRGDLQNLPTTTWIRWEKQGRYHAVYVEAGGGFWTYCSLFIRMEGVKDHYPTLPHKRARCGGCLTRVKCPYLVPDKLARIRGEVIAS